MKQLFFFFLLLPFITWSQSDFEKGERMFGEAKFKQAQVLFDNFLKSNPNHIKSIEYLGDIASHNSSWENATLYYRKLKELKPSEANYFYKYGGALGMRATQVNKFKALGMIGEIKGSFEKAIELNPKHIEARWALVMYYIQLPGILGGSETKALRYSNELLKLSPVDGYLSKGQIFEYFKKYTLAEEQYKKAIAAGSTKTGTQLLANLQKNKLKKSSDAGISNFVENIIKK
jgi:tetratricopeptide (TPR) repeat protein